MASFPLRTGLAITPTLGLLAVAPLDALASGSGERNDAGNGQWRSREQHRDATRWDLRRKGRRRLGESLPGRTPSVSQ